MKRGFYTEFLGIQTALVAGLFALVEPVSAIGGSGVLATPAWRIVCAAYVLGALAWAIHTAYQRLPEACLPIVKATRRLGRLGAAQRVYPLTMLFVVPLGLVWLGLWTLGDDLPRVFWEEPRARRARIDGTAIAVRMVLFEIFMLLDALLLLACLCIVARRAAIKAGGRRRSRASIA